MSAADDPFSYPSRQDHASGFGLVPSRRPQVEERMVLGDEDRLGTALLLFNKPMLIPAYQNVSCQDNQIPDSSLAVGGTSLLTPLRSGC